MDETRTNGAAAYDVVVLGAGYAGLMAALRLRRHRQRLRIGLVNASDRFVERVRLQETVAKPVAPRIPSIAALVAGSGIEFIGGKVMSLDPVRRRVRIATLSAEREIVFVEAVYALGSRIAVESIEGASEHAYRLDPGEGPRCAAALRLRLQRDSDLPLRVVVVGGAETAVEAAGEIKGMRPSAEVTMITRTRCGDFKGARVEAVVRSELSRLGVAMIDGETVAAVGPTQVRTASGRSIACDIAVFSGGLRAPQLACDAGLATDPQGRIWVDPNLRSISHRHILAVGDAAHPVAPTGAPYRLSAFVALASGAYAADVILAGLKKRPARPFSFSTFGQGVSIGPSGVGFASYPDDQQTLFILRGPIALHVRNFFVWFASYALKLERRFPGFFYWPGGQRVSWEQANQTMKRAEAA